MERNKTITKVFYCPSEVVDELPLFIGLIILKTSAVAIRIYQHPVLVPWSSEIKKGKG